MQNSVQLESAVIVLISNYSFSLIPINYVQKCNQRMETYNCFKQE